MDDLTVKYRNIQDESIPQRDSTVVKYRRYDFFIGKHRPFTERVELDQVSDAVIAERIRLLKQHLQNLPT